jgi:hypothetical protein
MAGPLDNALSILGGGQNSSAPSPAPTAQSNAAALNYLNDPKNRASIMADADRIAAARPAASGAHMATTPDANPGALSGAMAILSGAQSEHASAAPATSTTENLLAGIGHGMVHAAGAVKEAFDMGANALDSAAKGTAIGRAADWLNDKLGMTPAPQALANTQHTLAQNSAADKQLMSTTAGKVGSAIGGGAVALPASFIPGANTAVGAAAIGAGAGALTTEGSLADRAKGAVGGAIGGVVGKGIGDALGWAVGKLASYQSGKAAAQAATNAGRDAAVQTATEAGYRLPPTEVKPSILNSALEGISGKIKTSQAASAKNQEVTNDLAKRALGLSEDVTLSPEILGAIRQKAGQSYEAIKGFGTINADHAYNKALDGLVATYQGAAKDFPGLTKPEVTNLVDSLRQPSFGSDSAIDAIRVLRETADAAFRRGDTGVAKASKGAAQAMEDLVDRNLQGSGQPELLDAYRAARQTIAKTYDVGRALNPATGDVSAPTLAALANKGKPLSGELKTIATTAQAFPKATQALKQNYNPVSPLDYAVAGATALHTGRVSDLLSLGVRPTIRSAILSRPYQAITAHGVGNYGPGLLSSGVSKTLGSQPLKDFLRLGGTEAGIELEK